MNLRMAGDTIQSIARRQCRKTAKRHLDWPASTFWKGSTGKEKHISDEGRSPNSTDTKPVSLRSPTPTLPRPHLWPSPTARCVHTAKARRMALTPISTGTPAEHLYSLRLSYSPSKEKGKLDILGTNYEHDK